MRFAAFKKSPCYFALSSVGVALLLCGCGKNSAAPSTTVLVAAQAQPVAPATPRPTAPPDPTLKFRRAQQIPNWAQKKIIHKVRVRPGEKVFALTFDDGPWPVYTRRILRILKENDVKATFFQVGDVVKHHAQLAREVRDAGHVIGNHSWNHPSRPRNPVGQVRDTDREIEKVLGFRPTLFRPPYGIIHNGMAGQAMKEGDAVIIWSSDSSDWKGRSSGQIARTILRQASPGGIALMHDGGGNRAATAAALPTIIAALRERGYRLVTVPELLQMRYVPPARPKPVSSARNSSAQKPRPKKR